MSVSKCSLFDCFTRTKEPEANKKAPVFPVFKVTEFLAQHPIPKGTKFTSAHRAWAYLTLGKEGHLVLKNLSKMEQSVMMFFIGIRSICKGRNALDLQASLKKISHLTPSKKAPGNIYHVLKTALREARHALKTTSIRKEAIGDLITFLKTEIQRIAPTEKKKEELEKTAFMTSAQLKKEAERHRSISWKTLAFLGGLLATGGAAAASGHSLYQKSLIGNELTWNQRSALGNELMNCQDFRSDFDFSRTVEQRHQKRALDLLNAPHIFTVYGQDQEHARIAREMIHEGLYEAVVPKIALKISDPETRLAIYKETVHSLMEKRGPQAAVEFAKKIPKDADRELKYGIRNRAYQSLLHSLCKEEHLEIALEAVPQLLRDYFYRDDAYRTIIETKIQRGSSEGLLDIAAKITFVETYQEVNRQIFEFFLSQGDFEGASKTIPNLARHLQKKAQQEIIKAQNNEKRIPLTPECPNEFSATHRIFFEDRYDAIYRSPSKK